MRTLVIDLLSVPMPCKGKVHSSQLENPGWISSSSLQVASNAVTHLAPLIGIH